MKTTVCSAASPRKEIVSTARLPPYDFMKSPLFPEIAVESVLPDCAFITSRLMSETATGDSHTSTIHAKQK